MTEFAYTTGAKIISSLFCCLSALLYALGTVVYFSGHLYPALAFLVMALIGFFVCIAVHKREERKYTDATVRRRVNKNRTFEKDGLCMGTDKKEFFSSGCAECEYFYEHKSGYRCAYGYHVSLRFWYVKEVK